MKALLATVMVLLAGGAMAQHHQHKHAQSPYASMQARSITALSDQQIADLRAGRGMGMALAAELNGFPGPMHVLELTDQLALSSDQRQAVQNLFSAMKAEAAAVGEKLIDSEAGLDKAFRERSIDLERLMQLTGAVGKTQGELRAVHLKYHLTTAELLTPSQSQRYAELRGYR